MTDYTSVKDFGAVGNGSTDDTDAIQSAIDWVGTNGGGTVYFPPGVYNVHLDSQNTSSGSASYQVAALKVPYDNVHLVGAGVGATVIRAQSTTGAYGIIQILEAPIQNGVVKITGGSLQKMTIDGRYTGNAVDGEGRHIVKPQGIKNYLFQDLHLKNSRQYGIGMQNGGFQNVTLRSIIIDSINRDGIDLKDNGGNSFGVKLENITTFNTPRQQDNTVPYACIDLQGEGLQLTNIYCTDIGSDGAGAAIRSKQSDEGRVTGGVECSMTNIFIENSGKELSHGIMIRAGGASITNAKIISTTGTKRIDEGMSIEQGRCSIQGCHIKNARIGMHIRKPGGANDTAVYPDPDGGAYSVVYGCNFEGIVNDCIDLDTGNVSIQTNVFTDSKNGIVADNNNAGNSDLMVANNIFKNVSGQKTLFKDGVNALGVFNNINDNKPYIGYRQTSTQNQMVFYEPDNTRALLISNNGIGFFNTEPANQQTVSGDITNNTAAVLRDLIIELAQYGLIKNATTN